MTRKANGCRGGLLHGLSGTPARSRDTGAQCTSIETQDNEDFNQITVGVINDRQRKRDFISFTKDLRFCALYYIVLCNTEH